MLGLRKLRKTVCTESDVYSNLHFRTRSGVQTVPETSFATAFSGKGLREQDKGRERFAQDHEEEPKYMRLAWWDAVIEVTEEPGTEHRVPAF